MRCSGNSVPQTGRKVIQYTPSPRFLIQLTSALQRQGSEPDADKFCTLDNTAYILAQPGVLRLGKRGYVYGPQAQITPRRRSRLLSTPLRRS